MIPDLTALGKNLLLRALTGERITFTRIEFGNGAAQDIHTATGLINPLLSADVSKILQEEDYVAVTASFSNQALSDGFRITEIGVYARDPGDDTQEILYALGNEDVSAADYVPDNTQRIFDMEQSVLVYIGNAQDVTAAINSSLVYASAADLTAHVENTSNPHQVDKKQVGLGNVPNVSTNDQTPTYKRATSLQPLTSGEKLSQAFGKIKRAIDSFINHLSEKNPHETTADDVGAARDSHLHSTNDINTGIWGIARGGTGAGTAKEALTKLGAMPVGLISERINVPDTVSLDPELDRIYRSMPVQSSKFVSALINGTFYELHIWKATDLYGSAELRGYLKHSGARRRVFFEGVWEPWEWDYPELYFNYEYRTTERFYGVAVYTRLVDFGELPNNSTKELQYTAESGTHAISVEGRIGINNVYLGATSLRGYPGVESFYATNGKICIKTNSNLNGYYACVQVKYTKS